MGLVMEKPIAKDRTSTKRLWESSFRSDMKAESWRLGKSPQEKDRRVVFYRQMGQIVRGMMENSSPVWWRRQSQPSGRSNDLSKVTQLANGRARARTKVVSLAFKWLQVPTTLVEETRFLVSESGWYVSLTWEAIRRGEQGTPVYLDIHIYEVKRLSEMIEESLESFAFVFPFLLIKCLEW